MFDKSIFEILALFFLAIPTFLSCASSSKDKSEHATKSKQKQSVSMMNKEQARGMMETKRIDIPEEKAPPVDVPKSKEEKIVKQPSKPKIVEQQQSKPPDDGKGKEKAKADEKTYVDVDNNVLVLKVSSLPKLDKTVSENIHTPAVHDRANRIAIDRLIIDPKHTQYGGNIDMLTMKEKQNKLTQIEHDLDNVKTEKTTETSQKSKNKSKKRVKIREDKCLLFETNEAPTDDEEEEQVPDGI